MIRPQLKVTLAPGNRLELGREETERIQQNNMLFGYARCSLGNICLRLLARNTSFIQRTHLQHNPSLWVQETEAKTHTTASESDHYLTATSLLLLTLEWNLLCYGACTLLKQIPTKDYSIRDYILGEHVPSVLLRHTFYSWVLVFVGAVCKPLK